jgi:PhoPQ-activated pathogenicity-related protein
MSKTVEPRDAEEVSMRFKQVKWKFRRYSSRLSISRILRSSRDLTPYFWIPQSFPLVLNPLPGRTYLLLQTKSQSIKRDMQTTRDKKRMAFIKNFKSNLILIRRETTEEALEEEAAPVAAHITTNNLSNIEALLESFNKIPTSV